MASNKEWVVPATGDERRFFVLDVSDEHIQQHDYFAAMDAELKTGGYEAMLYDLLHYDISGFNVRRMPETRHRVRVLFGNSGIQGPVASP